MGYKVIHQLCFCKTLLLQCFWNSLNKQSIPDDTKTTNNQSKEKDVMNHYHLFSFSFDNSSCCVKSFETFGTTSYKQEFNRKVQLQTITQQFKLKTTSTTHK